ncbi:autophagy-related protein 2 [Quercus suber]|uniref:Autophagy-related protein 2 n=1 Tax=Quercus suber TaxID=58331 RepID=A0AAW0JK12_QUESU
MIVTEQQHVETTVKAAFAEISVMLSFHDEDQKNLCDPEDDLVNVHCLAAECRDIVLLLKVCSREMKFEGIVKSIAVANYFSSEKDAMNFGLNSCTDDKNSQSLLIHQLQAEVQGALPPFTLSSEDPYSDEVNDLVSADFPFGSKDGLVKVILLKTSGITHCEFSLSSASSDGSFSGPASFSLELSPFVFWVNFPLVNTLLNLSVEVVKYVEMNTKMNESPSEVITEKHKSSTGYVKSSTPRLTALSSTERLRGNILIPNARLILCFPFESGKDSRDYSSYDQFIVLDFSSPLASNKGVIEDRSPTSDATLQKNQSSIVTSSLHLNVGDLYVYLVLSDGHVTGPLIAKRAKFLATLGSCDVSLDSNTYEFASASAVKDLEDLNSRIQQEMIVSSVFFLHVCLSPVTITLGSSQYNGLHNLLNQIINGFSCVDSDASDAAKSREGPSVSQTSLLMECDSVEILINLDAKENIGGPMQSELPGSWYCLRLKIRKFELLSVSNIGGVRGANLFWLAHGEGELWGSITGVPGHEFLLISCSNSTMKRGDGGGSNALSSRLAGSDIVYLWEPESLHGFTSITVRCGTIVATGGRLDWLDKISSFFSLPSPEAEQEGDNSMQKGDLNASCGSSFVLNLVDIGLSYEPYLKRLVAGSEVLDSKCCFLRAKEKECMGEQYVACLLAASSFNLSTSTVANSIDNDSKIRVQDLGLLLRTMSEPRILVAVIVRNIFTSGLLWEVECSKSHICLETCHDTTAALIRLSAQLQQLFAPDVEESIVHLQARWNDIQKAQDRNDINDESRVFSGDSEPSTSQVNIASVDTKSEPVLVGLMDEICEDEFSFNDNHACQFDPSESQICVSLDESVLEDACSFHVETPEILSHDLSFNGLMPVVELESGQTSILEEGYFTEFREGNCLPELRRLSELSIGRQSLPEIPKCKSTNVGNGDIGKGNSGWLQGVYSLRTLMSNWRMYAGSDWHDSRDVGEHSIGGICVSKLSLSVQDFRLYDKSSNAPWKQVLGYYNSKDHPRESSSKAFKLDLEAVRPDPLVPLEEYRLRIAFLPILLHLHQSQLDFLIDFFGAKSSSVDQSLDCHQDADGSKLSQGHTVANEALLPFFQKFDIWPVLVRVDYSPRCVDLAALRGGKYVELVNLVPWKGVELQLKHVHSVGIYGWGGVFETIIGEWLEDISQNQVHKILQGLPTIRSVVAVGSGAAKLVSLPVESYRKDRRLLKGMQRGTVAFLRSISLEAVGLGVHLAAGANDILLQAECILSIPPSGPWAGQSKMKTNVRSNQPKDAQQGLQRAYESLSDGLGKSASALVGTPLKKYQRGAGAISAFTSAVQAIPAAAIAPASACATAVHYTLLGFRNSLDPERKKESMEKYLGPTRSQEHD